MKSSPRIDIVFAIDDGYTNPVVVTAYSVIKNNVTFGLLCFHIINNGLSDVHKKQIKELENFSGVSVDFTEIDDKQFYEFPSNIRHISPIAYSRFLTAELYPQLDTVLYLDADILVLTDLGELWATQTSSKCIVGAHKAYINKQFPGYKRSIGLQSQSTYVNSGVLVMNLRRIRKLRKTQQLLKNAKDLKDIVRIQDQDIINITFQGEIARFHKKYNYTDSDRREGSLTNHEVAIVHFNTRNKPWGNDFKADETNRSFAEKYQEYHHEIIAE